MDHDLPGLSYKEYALYTLEDLTRKFKTSASGLTDYEVRRRLLRYGKNEVRTRSTTALRILARQLMSPFIYILLSAAAISYLLSERTDAILILIFVALNTILGFYQEYRSEQTVRLLRRYIVRKIQVRRNGVVEVAETTDIVPGDMLILEPGTMIPADVRFVEASELAVDESALTGESAPVKKTDRVLPHEPKNTYLAHNTGFTGTTVVSGRALALVCATGSGTEFAKINTLTAETHKESTFEKEIRKFSTFILKLVVVTLVAVVCANLFIKGTGSVGGEYLIFAIALAVSVVPEALPVVTTFSFARGALRLAKRKVVVKRLSAVEDLGSIDVLCTDKTGTLTENRLTLGEVYAQDYLRAVSYAYLAKTEYGKDRSVNPFDEAVKVALNDHNMKHLETHRLIDRVPFDPARRCSFSLVSINGDRLLICRGAPESVTALCGPMDEKSRNEMAEFIRERGHEGKRVIAVAVKKLSHDANSVPESVSEMEFQGVLSFFDPIKRSVAMAVAKAKGLGVSIRILTGDAPEVAGWVGYRIGLIDTVKDVITGDEFDALPSGEQHQAVGKYRVFARVGPEQKFRIIQLLKEHHEVGFLGEGMNDAPALKIANVALAVDHASDIAREASDIILLKKDLKVIVDGILEGREILANTTKYITATLAANFGNFYAVAAASLFISYLPMLPVQILLVNLLSDFPMIAMAADSVDPADLARPKTYDLREILHVATYLGIVSSFFDFITFGILVTFGPAILQTGWFMESILTELAFIYSIRVKPFFLRARAPRLPMVALTVIAALATIVLPYTRIGQELFSFVPLSSGALATVFVIVVSYLIVTETVKILYYRSIRRDQAIPVK
jgi:P-type Mg2+ transporter